jgi:hypothetical protein
MSTPFNVLHSKIARFLYSWTMTHQGRVNTKVEGTLLAVGSHRDGSLIELKAQDIMTLLDIAAKQKDKLEAIRALAYKWPDTTNTMYIVREIQKQFDPPADHVTHDVTRHERA